MDNLLTIKAGVQDFCLPLLAVRVITKTLSTRAYVIGSAVAYCVAIVTTIKRWCSVSLIIIQVWRAARPTKTPTRPKKDFFDGKNNAKYPFIQKSIAFEQEREQQKSDSECERSRGKD